MPIDLLLIGKIVGAHNIKGAVKAILYADSLDVIAQNQDIWVEDSLGEKKRFTVELVKPYRKTVYLTFKGVTDRNIAEGLINSQLYIEKQLLPDLEEDEYYWRDVIGMDVYDIEAGFLGKVESIIQTGSNDVYVVKQGDVEILLPALASVITDIRLETKTMRVNIPEGLR